MKKIITDIRTLAALLIASATFVACSSDDNIIDDNIIDEQPASQQVYTLSVSATKGGDEALTRALSLVGKTLNASWAEGEEVTVYNVTKTAVLGGVLTAQSSGSSTTLKGTLTGTIEAGDVLDLLFRGANYTSQEGTLDYIAANCDYAKASVTVASVADQNITTTGTASFVNQQAIVKFTFTDGTNNLNVSRLAISTGSGKLVKSAGLTKTDAKTYYTGYTADEGSGGRNGDDTNYAKLVDGDTNTRWWTSESNQSTTIDFWSNVWYIDFHTSSAVQVDGYRLTTDNYEKMYSGGQNPKSWTLEAKASSSGSWTTIDTRNNNTDLPAEDNASVDFSVNVPGKYQYFRLKVSDIREAVNNEKRLALSEMQLFGFEHQEYTTDYGELTIAPTSATNELTIALSNENGAADDYTLLANVGGEYYYYHKSGVTFTNGNYYDIKVKLSPITTLAELKTLADTGIDCSSFLGRYVDASGNLSTSSDNAIGLVAYISSSDVEESVSGSRILVLATEDVSFINNKYSSGWVYAYNKSLIYGIDDAYVSLTSMNGLQFCSTHNAENYSGSEELGLFQYTSARRAYYWDKSRPAGSSNWFVPSYAQFMAMESVALTTLSTDNAWYWTTTQSTAGGGDHEKAYQCLGTSPASNNWLDLDKIEQTARTRACFAY